MSLKAVTFASLVLIMTYLCVRAMVTSTLPGYNSILRVLQGKALLLFYGLLLVANFCTSHCYILL